MIDQLSDGTHYLAMDRRTPLGTPPLFRVVVKDGLMTAQELFAVHEGGWVATTEVTKMLIGLSDDQWVRVTPEVAAEIVARNDAWWAAKKEAESGADD